VDTECYWKTFLLSPEDISLVGLLVPSPDGLGTGRLPRPHDARCWIKKQTRLVHSTCIIERLA